MAVSTTTSSSAATATTGSAGGGGGDETLDGGAGNDTLTGVGVADLTGGEGADTFHFVGFSASDVICDFDPTEGDVIHLEIGWEGERDIHDYDDLVASHLREVGDDTVVQLVGTKIDMDRDTIIVLEGVSISDLTEDAFAFW